MLIHLHKQATTTPKVRAAIQSSDEAVMVLADRFGVTPQTVYKWRNRDSVEDRSHTPHRLQTTLTPAQEAVAVALRRTLLVSLDDLLAVVREFLNPNVSRSGLDRCLRRHGVGNLRDLQAKPVRPKHSGFKAYEPGYIHIDVKYLPQMADESRRRYLFVAIDRATRWVFIRVFKAKTAANARRFLRDLERACPLRIRTILTDNGKEFTDRLFGLRKRAATGVHEFDQLCAALDIEHRLTPPKSPQTNGMVERFNGRIEEVLQSHHFRSGEELETTLHRYVWLYNQQLPQSALGSKPPLQALKDWHKLNPELFKKQPYYLPGCDSYAHAKQFRRMRKALRTLRGYTGRVMRDIRRQLDAIPAGAVRDGVVEMLARVSKLLHQAPKGKGKIYALHEPEVDCISKGKARVRYEFGCKVSVATTIDGGFVVGMRAMPGNPYDGHTLAEALEQVETLTDRPPALAVVDRGYRGHDVRGTQVLISGMRRGLTKGLKAQLRRRSAIEPEIGHMKTDGRLARCPLKGTSGDAIFAVLCGCGHNIRKILARLRAFLALFIAWIADAVRPSTAANDGWRDQEVAA